MSKYTDIHTADQLQAAIKGIRSDIKSQEKILSVKYDGLHEHYRPSNMVAGFLKRNSDYYNWADVSLRMVRALKSRFGAPKRPVEPEQKDQWINDSPLEEETAADEKSLGAELKDAATAFMNEVREKVANDDIA